VVLILIVILWGRAAWCCRSGKRISAAPRPCTTSSTPTRWPPSAGWPPGWPTRSTTPCPSSTRTPACWRDIVHVTENFPVKEKFVKHINAITRSVERCSTITHRLLGFAKRMDTRIEAIDLHSLIQEVLAFWNGRPGTATSRSRTISTRTCPPSRRDKGQLQQVFLNILNNSFAAVADGGRIDITLEKREGDRVAATIADNGCGIAEEDLPHIFEPFFSRRKEYGTGLVFHHLRHRRETGGHHPGEEQTERGHRSSP